MRYLFDDRDWTCNLVSTSQHRPSYWNESDKNSKNSGTKTSGTDTVLCYIYGDDSVKNNTTPYYIIGWN